MTQPPTPDEPTALPPEPPVDAASAPNAPNAAPAPASWPALAPAHPVALAPAPGVHAPLGLPQHRPVTHEIPGGTNGFAIASLVLGIIGGVLLSVIFGIVALVQIPKRRQTGKGLAIAGLSLSGAWTVGIIAIVVIAINVAPGSAKRDPSGAVVTGGRVSLGDLRPGDCIKELKEDVRLTSLPAVPCSEPHDGEVFARFPLTGSSYPGDVTVDDLADTGCNDALASYAPDAVEDPDIELFVSTPTRQTWSRNPYVTCLATNSQGATGSIRG